MVILHIGANANRASVISYSLSAIPIDIKGEHFTVYVERSEAQKEDELQSFHTSSQFNDLPQWPVA